MTSDDPTIHHVSDTALWVAYFRAKESLRPDALFQDPLAQALIGERGKRIAESMKGISLYVDWSVVIRTRIIDGFIENIVKKGVDTIINLGAGMDTRPYRLKLPHTTRWVEVDYPHVTEHKEKYRSGETPLFSLERVKLDLSDRGKRQEFFSPEIYAHFRTRKRMKQLKNSPFLFFPANWFGFFKQHGWTPHEIRYTTEESLKLGRKIPAPWWSYLLLPFIPKKTLAKLQKRMGYVLWTPAL